MSDRSNGEPLRLKWLGLVLGFALGLAISLLTLEGSLSRVLGSWSGLQVVEVAATAEQPVGAWGPIPLRFNHHLDESSIVGRVTLTEGVELAVEVDGDWLLLTPARPLAAGEHSLELAAGIEALNGSVSKAPQRATFVVRSADVLFLRQTGEGRQLLRWNNGAPLVLSGHEQVSGYTADPSGEHVIYAAANEMGGADLWWVDREGQGRRVILRCGEEHCSEPAWSPDGDRIAFVRQGTGAPRIWTMDTERFTDAALFQDESVLGRDPQWSPDGLRLSAYDPESSQIWVLNLDTGRIQVVPSGSISSGSWSPDGIHLAIVTFRFEGEEPLSELAVVNTRSREITPVLTAADGWTEVGLPSWSPDGSWLAVSGRREGAQGIALWLVRPGGSEVRSFKDDPSVVYGGPRWDILGERLLFQRFPLTSAGAQPDLMLWDREADRVELVAENAALGMWIP